MKRLRMQPNTRSYNALLSACERAGQADRALEVFANMRRAAAAGRLQLQPTEVTYNTLLSACGKAGRCAHVSLNQADSLRAVCWAAFRSDGGHMQHAAVGVRQGRQVSTLAQNQWISSEQLQASACVGRLCSQDGRCSWNRIRRGGLHVSCACRGST